MLLRPDKAIITEPHHVWPTLTDEQWIKARLPMSRQECLLCAHMSRHLLHVGPAFTFRLQPSQAMLH